MKSLPEELARQEPVIRERVEQIRERLAAEEDPISRPVSEEVVPSDNPPPRRRLRAGDGFLGRRHRPAAALLDQHTALAGPGTGWDLHEYRPPASPTSASRVPSS
ncbi:hypothetical protein ACIHFD_41695 [Nonomuraea sp. NPDC051941]|uniref:hypothetical protein n=1 Tax=Nonomuraea sp. NPDC051941 TaxID=3364373 RepID=UPI0037CC52B8